MAASTGARRPLAFVEDTAVDPAVLGAYARRFREVLGAHGLSAGFYGHASVGCLHVRPFVDLTQPGQVQAMRAVAEQIRDLVLEFGGVNSSEHGDGLARSEFNRAVFGDPLYAAMCEVKRLFDPENRMNPGKITGAPPMTSNLREAAPPSGHGYASKIGFPGGMRAAADRCMNIGLCRKSAYRRDVPLLHGHPRRGAFHQGPGRRAGEGPGHARPAGGARRQAAARDPRPVPGVQGLQERVPARRGHGLAEDRGPGRLPRAARRAAALPDVRFGPGAEPDGLRRRAAGEPARRRRGRPGCWRSAGWGWRRPGRCPGSSGSTWPGGTPAARPAAGSRGDLVFLADSFTSYTEPSVARAAIELLEAAGWAVRLETAACCGRASLSKGLVDQARDRARHLLDRVDGRGPVVGVEPSCLLTLRDEYPAILPGDPRAKAVAEASRLPEELLNEAIADGRLTLGPIAAKRILYHGHCHLKAVTGTAATMTLLRAIPGTEVAEVDAGCCGMAGSFGFEAEHYDLSMQIGELRLFPAVRAEPAGTVIAASGVSCRQQIAHGTGRAARHPLEIVRSALIPPAASRTR